MHKSDKVWIKFAKKKALLSPSTKKDIVNWKPCLIVVHICQNIFDWTATLIVDGCIILHIFLVCDVMQFNVGGFGANPLARQKFIVVYLLVAQAFTLFYSYVVIKKKVKLIF